MNNIDYSKYNITCTTQFENGLAKLKDNGNNKEITKLFKLIEEIIQDIDMYEKEYARPLKNSSKIIHIHLDGKHNGNILFLYTVQGHDIDIDLRLYNIVNHENLDRVSKPKFTNKQSLHAFDVISNKYTDAQLNYAEICYLDLISDYKFYQLHGQERKEYSEKYMQDYIENTMCEDNISWQEFIEIIYHFENKYKKHIFGSFDFSDPQYTSPITITEEQYILDLFESYNIQIQNAYIENEIDEYGDSYEYLCISTFCDDFKSSKLLEYDLHSLQNLFQIMYESKNNGLGYYGKDYEFFHYFE